MQSQMKNILPRETKSISLKKDNCKFNNTSNFTSKSGLHRNSYVKHHLDNNVIPGMLSYDNDYMDAIKDY